jgi:hypothetical protein
MKKFQQIPNFYNNLKNPEKYVGERKIITIRSSLELKLALRLDQDKNILQWSSEDKIIKYKDLLGKYHKYFMDFWIKYINHNGIIAEKYIEVKPFYQTIPPKTTYSTYSKAEWIKNNLKWQATREFCLNESKDKNKIVMFQILTEKDI